MNLFKGRSARARKQYFMLPLFLLTAIVFSYRFFFPSSAAAEHASSYLMYPLLVVQNSVVKPVKLFFERQKSVEELAALLKKAQQEQEDLLARNIVLQSSAYYADQTRDLADFRERYAVQDAHLAQILLRQLSDQAHFVFIDRGTTKGVQPNMVAVYKNCLIGRVSEVYPSYSKVLLVTDKTCKIAAMCGATKSSGIHEGLNKKDYCTLNYVSHLCMLEEGELVISSGEGLVFPQGFGLGKIKSFARKGLFYDVVVEPLVDIKNIDYCYIIQKGEL